jgi:hypothetical protein
MAENRYRLRFTFWLDMLKPEEVELADQIELLKNDRSFVRSIRDGLHLVTSLRQGRTDVLFELFPWLKNELVSSTSARSENALQRQLERLETLILQQGAIPIDAPKSTPGSPKALPVPKFSTPDFDDSDDLDTVIIQKDTSTNSAMNFVNSMLNLQQ